MLKISIFLLTIGLSLPTLCQYTQNIDSLSRKEIKKLILELDENKEARILLKKSNAGKTIGGFLMVSGALLMVTNQNKSDNHEADIGAIYNAILGALISVTGLITYVASANKTDKAIDIYSSNSQYLNSKYIKTRDEAKILKSIFYSE